jgi:hypothetical protein
MVTIFDKYTEIRNHADFAHSIYKKKGFCPEYREARKPAQEIVDSLDPALIERFRKAQQWVDQNHPLVGCNSTWSNCKSKEDIMLDYLGFSEFRVDRKRKDEEFKTSDVSSKQMIVDGFKYYTALLNKERDILSAGDIDISHTDRMEEAIKTMLLSLDDYDNNLDSL